MTVTRGGRAGLSCCALTVVAASLTACGGQPSPTSRQAGTQAPARAAPPGAVARLSLRRQVGELLILSFHGGRAPAYVRAILRDGTAGGTILFGDNVQSASQLRALTRALQRAAGGSALIAVDQEGGRIRIVPFSAPAVGQPQLATAARAAAAARDAASDLRGLGINVNLAPVADVPSSAAVVIRDRAFPGDAASVAELVRAAARAYAGSRVAATAKHFPGFGAAGVNTDLSPVTIDRSAARLRGEDLAPFRAAVDAGVPIVMASHALYPALDRRRIASQSMPVLDGILRRELRFTGVVMTDSIEAVAVRRRSSVQTAAVRSVTAGADIVLMTGPGSFRLIYPRLLAEARRSPAFRRRVRAAAARVLELKRKLGLPAPA
ncbi:MAG: beta-N-acetylhexosaminidase [Solirubrobacteraceae bacterium]|nr:beta-N-acetylhexosaminidase [Solirubrobacteraceae bacterium]